MKYRKLPVVIEATQWFKNGDHPSDEAFVTIPGLNSPGIKVQRGGGVVHRYPWVNYNEHRRCVDCRRDMRDHGWIETSKGGYQVCPGDWIITGVNGEYYPCQQDNFKLTYEPA